MYQDFFLRNTTWTLGTTDNNETQRKKAGLGSALKKITISYDHYDNYQNVKKISTAVKIFRKLLKQTRTP